MGFYSRTLKDYDGESTTFKVRCASLNAGNIADQITLQSALGTAINGITTGSLQKISYGNDVVSNGALPTDQWSQREIRWLITYRDTVTGKLLQCELGTADLTHLDPDHHDKAHIGDAAEVDAFITAFNAYVLSDVGNAVAFVDMVPVGRNY